MKINKIWSALILALVLLTGIVPAAAAENAQVVVLQINNTWMAVDGTLQPVDAENERVCPIIENGRTLVPVSRIITAFGGTIGWDAKTKTATFTLNGHTAVHRVGTSVVDFDSGRRVVVMKDVSSSIRNSRTYVPLRTILEGLELTVNYEADHRLVVVSQGPVDENALDQLVGAKLLLGTYDPKTDGPGDTGKLPGQDGGSGEQPPAPSQEPEDYGPVQITYLDKDDGGSWVAAGEHACNLFDGDLNTSWRLYNDYLRTGVFSNDFYCIFSLSRPVSITGYTMTVASADLSGAPHAWSLYGANCDGTPGDADWDGWELIDLVYDNDGIMTDGAGPHRFTLERPAPAYQHYRLSPISGQEGSPLFSIAEFTLTFAGGPAALDLPAEYYSTPWKIERAGGTASGTGAGSDSSSNGVCSVCHGAKRHICTVCNGKGYISYATGLPGKDAYKRKPCPFPLCQGGWVNCSACGGTGRG